MPRADATSDSGSARRTVSGPVLAAELLLGLLALATFLLLLDARRDANDNVVSLSERFQDATPAWFLVALLAVLLIVCILLLFVGARSTQAKPAAKAAQPAASYSEAAAPAAVEWDNNQPGPPHSFSLGCRGCGTVFTHTGHVGDRFTCPNCSRDGVIADRAPVVADVHEESCPHCGATFEAYLNHAECPSCHQPLDR